ncbi:MAG: AbrB/MazE/SpoVT family DNA-binding domain-containing protein [Alkalispirochaeta sp.]|jgi:AbrB family looped-hinge helix DNA binding protein
MKVTLTVTDRGTVTLPAKLRKEMGIGADSLLIAEATEEGILLRPAVALPVEVYSQDRLAEFAAAERDLDEWYGEESR